MRMNECEMYIDIKKKHYMNDNHPYSAFLCLFTFHITSYSNADLLMQIHLLLLILYASYIFV